VCASSGRDGERPASLQPCPTAVTERRSPAANTTHILPSPNLFSRYYILNGGPNWYVLTDGCIFCLEILIGSGFHPHLPGFKHKFLAKALGATMWFFIFYRARFVLLSFTTPPKGDIRFREDGPKLLVCCRFIARTDTHCVMFQGLKHPWEGHGHGHHGEEISHH